jgi:hypothetical protein
MESLRSILAMRKREEGPAGYAKVASPDFRHSLTEEQKAEAIAAGIGACWGLTEAEE